MIVWINSVVNSFKSAAVILFNNPPKALFFTAKFQHVLLWLKLGCGDSLCVSGWVGLGGS